MALDGDAAVALGELARSRWEAAGGKPLKPPVVSSDPWPEELEPCFREIDVGIARTRGKREDVGEIRENEQLFIDLIRSAKDFIYAESQYFASRVIAGEMAARLKEPKGPEIVLVQPRSADGWLEEGIMGTARYQLMKVLKDADHSDRFRIYTPVNAAGDDIYVHSKIMIVDDRVLRVGSSNMNNRSLGLDSECDVVIDAELPANIGLRHTITAIRRDLLAEHLGVEAQPLENLEGDRKSLIRCIEELRSPGTLLSIFDPPKPDKVEKVITDTEALDPEDAEGSFEPIGNPGLLAGLHRR